jgi:acyl carrier protein
MGRASRDEVRVEVARILSSVLGHPVSAARDAAASDDPAWDSLRHVEVIYAVEDTFELRFEETAFPKLVSLEMIVDAVVERLA